MAEPTSIDLYAIEHANHVPGDEEQLLNCCSCKDRLRDPIILNCLHNCCRACFDSHFSHDGTGKLCGRCSDCFDITECVTAPQNGFLCSYLRVKALKELDSLHCSTCDSNEGSPENAAEYWCTDCCTGLCADCYSWHCKFTARHRRTALVKVARDWPVSQLLESCVQCERHERKLEAYCFSCCELKCSDCRASCKADQHHTRLPTDDETVDYSLKVAESGRAAALHLRKCADALKDKIQAMCSRLQKTRTSSSRELRQRRCAMARATDDAWNTSVHGLFSYLHRTKSMRFSKSMNFIDLTSNSALTDSRVQLRSTTTLKVLNIYALSERRRCRAVLAHCVTVAASSGRHQLNRLNDGCTIRADSTALLTADVVLRACLGGTQLREAQPTAPQLFPEATISYQTHVECWDAAVMINAHVLVAALEHGMLEYSEIGSVLNGWQPPARTSGEADEVLAVEAFADGRAAAAVAFARVVALLRRCALDSEWYEERRITGLQFAPGKMSAQSDLVAVTEYLPDSQHRWARGRQLELARLSSGKLLYSQMREYDVWGVAVTALCVVTTSRGQVKLSNEASSYLIDAYTHGGTLLWRYLTRNSETLTGVCSGATEHMIYACLLSRNGSRVAAIGGADGIERQGNVLAGAASGTQKRPAYLSLACGRRKALLAVLSFHGAVRNRRIVTLYETGDGSEKKRHPDDRD